MEPFPYEIRDVDEETASELAKDFTDKYVYVGPNKFVLPKMYIQFAQKYYNLKLKPEDVLITGFPRSGTTMTEELVWLLLNEVDVEKAKTLTGFCEKIQFLEIDLLVKPRTDDDEPEKFGRFDDFLRISDPRVFKTHLSLSFLPPDLLTCGCKVIYVVRNPKDIMVSYYHLQLRRQGSIFKCDFPTFANYIMDNKLRFTPFWTLLEQYWQHRDSPNLLFIFYEDFIKDLKGSIMNVARFLGKNLNDKEVEILAAHLKFDNFKRILDQNDFLQRLGNDDDGFARKGQYGQSGNYFRGDLKKKTDKWIEENVERIGIKYSYLD